MAKTRTTFAIRITFMDGAVTQHTTRQAGFAAAEAWARSKHFQSIKAGKVSMIAVKRAGA